MVDKKIRILLAAMLLISVAGRAQRFYGMTEAGGVSGSGTIFTMKNDATGFEKIHDFFSEYSGGQQQQNYPIEIAPGLLAGMTYEGGSDNLGVIYTYNYNTAQYAKLYDFVDSTGSGPFGGLMKASNGKLYGLTRFGGHYNGGVIFEFDVTSKAYKVLHYFKSDDGVNPMGELTEGAPGRYYGVTSNGAKNLGGTLFEYDIFDGAFSVIVEFDSVQFMSYPQNGMVLASNHKLYGVTTGTSEDGTFGTLFELDPAGNKFKKLKTFNHDAPGGKPTSSLIEFSDGLLYGTTYYGGNNDGSIFSYNIATNEVVERYSFFLQLSSKPVGKLVTANGKIYGTTTKNILNRGIFEFDPATNTLVQEGDNASNLVAAQNNKIYGTHHTDYSMGLGTLFDFVPETKTQTSLFDFGAAKNGSSPTGTLTQAVNGKLYGVTQYGGVVNKNVYGVLVEVDTTNNTVTKKLDFGTDAINPIGDLALHPNGLLYGINTYSMEKYIGGIFSYDPSTNQKTEVYLFNYAYPGSTPASVLILGPNGKLYGATYSGGHNNTGTIYEFDPIADTVVAKYDFLASDYSTFTGNLIFGSDGKLYGTTVNLYTNKPGYLFQLDIITGAFKKVWDFVPDFRLCPGAITLGPDQKIYGTTHKVGEWFAYTIATGAMNYFYPASDAPVNTNYLNLTTGSNGNIYGQSLYGGRIVEYNIASNKYTEKKIMNGLEGGGTIHSNKLSETRKIQSFTFEQIPDFALDAVPPPVKATATSGLTVSVSSLNPEKAIITNNALVVSAAGRVNLIAVQTGNTRYLTTTIKEQSFCINPVTPVITVTNNATDTIYTSSNTQGNQWYRDDVLVEGATAAALSVEKSGVYTVKTTIDGCPSNFSQGETFVPHVYTGTYVPDEQLIVYPNPSDNVILIRLGGMSPAKSVDIVVVDFFGATIETLSSRGEEQVTLDVRKYRSGKYTIIARQGNIRRRTGFIKI